MSQRSIGDRLSFMKLDAKGQAHLRDIKPIVRQEISGALEGFYNQIRATPETRAFFSGDSHIAAAKSAQTNHWQMISDAQLDARYVGAVTRIGEVHARIGLEPSWYIGGYALVLEALIGKVLEARWPKGVLRGKGAETVAAEVGALAKATLLDMDFAISVYLEALQTARKEADAERQKNEDAQNLVMKALADSLRRLAGGDLSAQVVADVSPRFQPIKDDFNQAVDSLREAMLAISASTSAVRHGSEEIALAADDLSRRTEQQAASLEQTAAALDEITVTVRTTASGAKAAAAVVLAARQDAEGSGEVVEQAVAAMSGIERFSAQVSQIVGVIDEIAFQTNLLALNAGVEAARAGDAGRGFAVVATEVRALAQRSADAAKEIKTLISDSARQVGAGVELVGQTGGALQRIVSRVAEIDSMVADIAGSAQEQSSALAEVNIAVNQMDQMTQQNAAMVEQTTAATANLSSEAGELGRLVGRFQTGAGAAPGHVDRRAGGRAA